MKNAAMMKKNAPKFIDENHVLVTKEFAKNARIFGTPEYKMWKEIRKDCENAEMVTKKIKKNPNKRTATKNMTYEHMAIYIRQQDNAETLMADFKKQIALWEGYNDLATKEPAIAEEWNYERNGELLPTAWTAGSNKKVWWKCSACGHEWESTVNNRTYSNNGCPHCHHRAKKKS